MRYLDPKADLTFKKVFGGHIDLVISFLNAMLPFESPDEEITEVQYLNPEMVPNTPFGKDSIVDVRCRDGRGRQFLVEMQMMWTSAYKQRVLFNASKAYVSQLGKGCDYDLLQPVYSLNLVNDTFSEGEGYYHDYRIVEDAETKEVIEGLRFIFIELPKFTPKRYSDKKMQVLWLRYLTEIDEHTREVSQDLLENPQISKAVTELEESAFTEEQLLGYEKFWDIVSTAKTNISSALRDGHEKGMKQGLKQGLKQGMEQGMKQGMEIGIQKGIQEERLKIAAGMKSAGMSIETIVQITGLTADAITAL